MTESADETGLFGAARSSPQGEAVLTAKMQLAALLRGTNLRSLTAEALRVELLKLLEGYQIQSIPYNYQQVWHRARVVEKGDCYSSLDQLIYPASGNRTYGRANLPGSSVMYGSWNVPTAADEINAEVGDIVQTITFRTIPGAQVNCYSIGNYRSFYDRGFCLFKHPPMFAAIQQLSETQPDAFMVSVFIDLVLSEIFGRINAAGYDNKLSAVYCELLMKDGGFVYPSVKNPAAMNIAISSSLFGSSFEVLTTEVARVEMVWGYGLYGIQVLRRCCDFDAVGNINWASTRRRIVRWSERIGWQFDASPGWRVAPKDNA